MALRIVWLLAFLSVSQGCTIKLIRCQSLLFSAITLLQTGHYAGYCRGSEGYLNCLVANLSSCDQRQYNVTSLANNTRQARAVYCTSNSTPGHEVCMSYLETCQAISEQAVDIMSNTTAYCRELVSYILCIDRDLSPCEQETFNTTTLTFDASRMFTQLCHTGQADSSSSDCDSLYVTCADIYRNTSSSLQAEQWQDYCNVSEQYLVCSMRIVSDCDAKYITPVTSSQMLLEVDSDRVRYCTSVAAVETSNYQWCSSKHRECTDRLHITGTIGNTIAIDYCRSLDNYTKCILSDLPTCQYDEFQLTRLDSIARQNWTEICYDVDINKGYSIHQFDYLMSLILGFLLLLGV